MFSSFLYRTLYFASFLYCVFDFCEALPTPTMYSCRTRLKNRSTQTRIAQTWARAFLVALWHACFFYFSSQRPLSRVCAFCAIADSTSLPTLSSFFKASLTLMPSGHIMCDIFSPALEPWPHSSDFLSHCLLVTSISYCFPQLRYRTSILIIRYQRECAQKEIYCPPLRLQCCPFCFSACQGDFPVSWRGRDHFQLIVRVGVWIIDHQIILVQFILFFKSS